MKVQKQENLKAFFEAISASNQKIFGICTSLIVYLPLALKKVQKLKMVLPAYFPLCALSSAVTSLRRIERDFQTP